MSQLHGRSARRSGSALFGVALLAAGCGSSGSSSSSGGGPPASTPATAAPAPAAPPAASAGGAENLTLAADSTGKLAFNKRTLVAKAGTVTITMANPSPEQHGISVEGSGVDKDGPVVAHGSTSTVTVTLKPGRYTFYCPVPGHKMAGMQGTLTVS